MIPIKQPVANDSSSLCVVWNEDPGYHWMAEYGDDGLCPTVVGVLGLTMWRVTCTAVISYSSVVAHIFFNSNMALSALNIVSQGSPRDVEL